MIRPLAKRARRRLRRRHRVDTVARWMLRLSAFGVFALIAGLLGWVLWHGAPAISWQFLTGLPSEGEAGGGIGPELFNSFYLLGLTMLFTVPIAVAAAVYMSEYAPAGPWTRAVGFASEVLSTVPSIVMGLFGLLVFVYLLRWRFSALGGALTLTLLNIPAMMRIATLAIENVPRSMREASAAMGATRWYTVTRVVLPGALGSLISGVILVAGRIFGETAALVYTAGVSIEPAAPYNWNVFHPAETLSVHLWYTQSESVVPDVARVGDGTACVLVMTVLLFNLGARGLGAALTRGRTAQ